MDTPPRLHPHPLSDHPTPGGALDRRGSGPGAGLTTPAERHAYLVDLAMEAFDLWWRSHADETPSDFRDRVAERMAQAAQVWTGEIDLAREESRS